MGQHIMTLSLYYLPVQVNVTGPLVRNQKYLTESYHSLAPVKLLSPHKVRHRFFIAPVIKQPIDVGLSFFF